MMLNYKNVYSRLSSAGKVYMGSLLRYSSNKNGPERIHKVMLMRHEASKHGWEGYHKMHKEMTGAERSLDETISNLSHKTPKGDRMLIGKYFRRKDYPRLSHKHHYGWQYAKRHPAKKVKIARTASGIDRHRPKATPDKASPELQRLMLARGVDLYRQLTPQGRKYMLECTQAASLDYNDFHQARYGDPNHLNIRQIKLRHQMMRESGYERSHNNPYSLVPISVHAMPEEQKRDVDKFLASKSSEAILDNGSAYRQLYLENLRERQLAETRRDEEEPSQRSRKQAPGMGVLNAFGQKAPTAFALGEATAGGIGATARLAKRGGKKVASNFNFSHKKSAPKHHIYVPKYAKTTYIPRRAKHPHINDDGPSLD